MHQAGPTSPGGPRGFRELIFIFIFKKKRHETGKERRRAAPLASK